MSESIEKPAAAMSDFAALREAILSRESAVPQAPTLDELQATVERSTRAMLDPEPVVAAGRSMGREVKVGLGVIASLMTSFGGLATYRFVDFAALRGEPPVAAASSLDAPPPRAVAAPLDTLPNENPWARRGAEDAAWPPRTRDEEPTQNKVAARDDVRFASDIPDADEPTLAANPFAAGRNEPAAEPREPQPLAARETQPLAARESQPLAPSWAEEQAPQKNPLRRASAEEPWDAPSEPAASLTPSWANRDDADSPSLPMSAVPERPTATRDDPFADSFSSPPVQERTPAARMPETRAPETRVPESRMPVERVADTRSAPEPRTRWQGDDERPLQRAVPPASPPANGKYTVGPNDSLWTISEKVYGSGNYFKAIAEFNKYNLPNPNRLQVGSVVSVPPVNVLEQKYPSLVPKQRKSALVEPRTIAASTRGRSLGSENVYVVEQGDTLFDIARYELGKASRWGEIYDLNRDVLSQDFDFLQPGTRLNMPSRTPSDNMTRSTDSSWQR